MTTSPWDLNKEDLAAVLSSEPKYRIDQLWHGLHSEGQPPETISALPLKLRSKLAERFQPALTEVQRQTSSDGKTVKWLWELPDGARIETVLMLYAERATVCISSQAGCAMACDFCATGQAGFTRHLTTGEILEQVVQARAAAEPRRLSNVVYMGMGEPMANYGPMMESLHRITGDFGIGARRVTVSTVGMVHQMRRFADEGLQVGLAVSLHAANDELRSQMIPINKRHPIAEVVDASRNFREKTGRRVSFEWAMIDGVNDRDSDVIELAKTARAAAAHVNLIPLNPTPGYPTVGTPTERIAQFAAALTEHGVNVTVRANRGTDIDAACGQLSAANPD